MLSYDLEPPTQVSVGELYIPGIERQRGEPYSMGNAVGGPKSYDGTETVVVFNILYSLLAPRWSSGRKTIFVASQDDGKRKALCSS